MSEQIRVRFAPSPTGPLHVGGVRTALYNYLFARQKQGTMILRIEDTDQSRYVECAEEYVRDALSWCGITPDEGPWTGGDCGPYRQSERKNIYRGYADQLIRNGHAYYAFDTPEELHAMRERLKAAKVSALHYNAITRNTMANSLTLPQEEVQKRIESGDAYVVRLKVPVKEDIRFYDQVRGWIKVHSSSLDDKVLLKSDGMPTYHLANIVDDHLMEISHVIRGEEWLPSAPLHVLLYRYLGWEESMPHFSHLPLILKPDGNGKLSKRDGEKHGYPVFPIEWCDPESGEKSKGFRESGYLSEAFVNFIALLGWNPGDENEVFSMDELIEVFSLEKVNKAGAKFDIEKAIWFNTQFLKKKSAKELSALLINILEEKRIDCDQEKAEKIVGFMQERISLVDDLYNKGAFFFHPPQQYDRKTVNKKWNPQSAGVLADIKEEFKQLSNFNVDNIKAVVENKMKERELGFGAIMPVLRVAVTGQGHGPDLMAVMQILGRDETVSRIDAALVQLDGQINA